MLSNAEQCCVILSTNKTSRDQQKTHYRPPEVKRPEHRGVKVVTRAAAVYDRQLKNNPNDGHGKELVFDN